MNIYDDLLKRAVARGLKIKEQMEQSENDQELIKKAIEFLRQNPYPDDDKVHEWASQIGIDPHKLEPVFYKIATNFAQLGKHRDVPDDKYDSDQLKMGIEVEKEHTDCPLLSKEIAKDHLAEIPDYYTRLKNMEEEGKLAFKKGKEISKQEGKQPENPKFFTHQELRDAARKAKK